MAQAPEKAWWRRPALPIAVTMLILLAGSWWRNQPPPDPAVPRTTQEALDDTALVLLAGASTPPPRAGDPAPSAGAQTAAAPTGAAAPAASVDIEGTIRLLKATQAAYAGQCPCPYDNDAAGKSCDAASLWSQRKAGPTPVLCYFSDITPAMAEVSDAAVGK